jgi:hemolysin III
MNPTVVSTSHAPLLSAPPAYSLAEELAHAVTHGVGIVLAIAGLCVLVAYAALYGSALHVVSCSIFGSSMILLYTGSTLYHSVQHVQAKYRLRKLDQSMVYLLIAGTYTPFNLITLNGPLGWWLFAITWSIALFGIAFCVVDHERHERFALAFYLGLGWSIVFAVPSLIHRMQFGGLVLLFGGGLSYTIGVGFYLRERLRYFHAIWHLFVLAGSTLHFFAVLLYVIPGAVPAH